MNSRLRARLAAALLVFALPACSAVTGPADSSAARDSSGGACTAIGCLSGYEIALEHTGAWSAGRYTLTVVADGATTACAVTLPFAGGCDGAPFVQCTPAGTVQVGESGCALPAAQHGLVSVRFGAASPASVRVTVARDGATLVERAFTPAYTTTQPNGPGCEPICRQARDTLAVP